MPGREKSLDMFDRFINTSKEITKPLVLVLPQYQVAAQDLYQLCQKLLMVNENFSRWKLQAGFIGHYLCFHGFLSQNSLIPERKHTVDNHESHLMNHCM